MISNFSNSSYFKKEAKSPIPTSRPPKYDAKNLAKTPTKAIKPSTSITTSIKRTIETKEDSSTIIKTEHTNKREGRTNNLNNTNIKNTITNNNVTNNNSFEEEKAQFKEKRNLSVKNLSIQRFTRSNSSLLSNFYNQNTNKLENLLQNNIPIEFMGNSRFNNSTAEDFLKAMKGGNMYNRFYTDYMKDQHLLDQMLKDISSGSFEDEEFFGLKAMIEECLTNLRKIDLTPVPVITKKDPTEAEKNLVRHVRDSVIQNRRWEYDLSTRKIGKDGLRNKSIGKGDKDNDKNNLDKSDSGDKSDRGLDKQQTEFKIHRQFLDKIQNAYKSYSNKIHNTQVILLKLANFNFEILNNKFFKETHYINHEKFNKENFYEYVKKTDLKREVESSKHKTDDFYYLGRKLFVHPDYVLVNIIKKNEMIMQTDKILEINKDGIKNGFIWTKDKLDGNFLRKIEKIQIFTKNYFKLKKSSLNFKIPAKNYTKLTFNSKYLLFIIKLQNKIRRFLKRIEPYKKKFISLYSVKKFTINNEILSKIAKIQINVKKFLYLLKSKHKNKVLPLTETKCVIKSHFLMLIILIQSCFRKYMKRRKAYKKLLTGCYLRNKVNYSYNSIIKVKKIQRIFRIYLKQLKGRKVKRIEGIRIRKEMIDSDYFEKIIKIQILARKFLKIKNSNYRQIIASLEINKEIVKEEIFRKIIKIQKNFRYYMKVRITSNKRRDYGIFQTNQTIYSEKILHKICKLQNFIKFFFLNLKRGKNKFKLEPTNFTKQTINNKYINYIFLIQKAFKYFLTLKKANTKYNVPAYNAIKMIKNHLDIKKLIKIQKFVKIFIAKIIYRRFTTRKYRAFRNAQFELNSQSTITKPKITGSATNKDITSFKPLLNIILIQRKFKQFLNRIKNRKNLNYEPNRIRKVATVNLYIKKSEPLVYKPKGIEGYSLTKICRLEEKEQTVFKINKSYYKQNSTITKGSSFNTFLIKIIKIQKKFKNFLMRKVKANNIKKYKLKSYITKRKISKGIPLLAVKKIQKAYRNFKLKQKAKNLFTLRKFFNKLSFYLNRWNRNSLKLKIRFKILNKLKTIILKSGINSEKSKISMLKLCFLKWINYLRLSRSDITNTEVHNKQLLNSFKQKIALNSKINWLITPIKNYLNDIKIASAVDFINKLSNTNKDLNRNRYTNIIQGESLVSDSNTKHTSKFSFKSHRKKLIEVSTGHVLQNQNRYLHFLAPLIKNLLSRNIYNVKRIIFDKIKNHSISKKILKIFNKLQLKLLKKLFMLKFKSRHALNKLLYLVDLAHKKSSILKLKILSAQMQQITLTRVLSNIGSKQLKKQGFSKIYNFYVHKYNNSLLEIRTPNILTLDNTSNMKLNKFFISPQIESQFNLHSNIYETSNSGFKLSKLDQTAGARFEIISTPLPKIIKTIDKTELTKTFMKNLRNNNNNIISRNETMVFAEYEDKNKLQNSTIIDNSKTSNT